MDLSSPASPVPAQAGIGLRLPHQAQVMSERPRAAWFEVHPENYMANAQALSELEQIAAHYPLSLHAVGLSLGSAEGIDEGHLERLKFLIRRLSPALVSDHLSWSVTGGRYLPDLLPLPYTEEALRLVTRNVSAVQEALGRTILVENPSTYLQFSGPAMSEPEFMAELSRGSGCGVLFDVNNVYVSASNQQLEPGSVLGEWCRALAPKSVAEIHLAGHALLEAGDGAPLRIDDHGDHVCAPVWALYEQTLAHFGPRPTLIEWDTRLPGLEVLQAEAALAQERLDECQRRAYDRAI